MTRIATLLATTPMTTTQFARQIRYKLSAPSRVENNYERQNLRMSWVVVTGAQGTRMLRMQWMTDENCQLTCPVTLL